MAVAYDAGVLVAADRGDRAVWADHRVRLESGVVPLTTAPVISQVSRSTRQAQLRRFLRGCEVVPFAAEHAHSVGALLGGARTADVVDAHLLLVAATVGAELLTADVDDFVRLYGRLSAPVRIRPI